MQEYYINRAEEKTTSTGKTLKKLELSQEGKQYPLKGVSIWGDHPLYSQAVAGATLQFDIYETDSGVPNPKAPGKNYINRSVSNPNQQNAVPTQPTAQGTQTANISEMALKTHITQEIAPVKEALRAIVEHLGVEAPKPKVGNTNVDYPEMTEENTGEIKDSDIPF